MRPGSLVSKWTDERVKRLTVLWEVENWSAQKIAEALGDGFTRHAVTSRVRRMKLKPHERDVARRSASAPVNAEVVKGSLAQLRAQGAMWAPARRCLWCAAPTEGRYCEDHATLAFNIGRPPPPAAD